ncbi:hypothetical protein PybrP1_001931, partial [[Pythium] brassicae (nom. inval.)]
FLAFLDAHEIRRSDLLGSDAHAPPLEQRYFRVKKHKNVENDDAEKVIACVAQSLGTPPTPVPWLPRFYALPAASPLARVDAYRAGEIYGIDISSGFAVSLLDVRPGDHVLDLCCAPGAKLTMIADLLQLRGSVTGVDVSRQRLSACKQLVHKYQLLQASTPLSSSSSSSSPSQAASVRAVSDGHPPPQQPSRPAPPQWRCRLFHADGRSFAVGPRTESDRHERVETVLDTEEIAARGTRGLQRKRANKSARAREARKQRKLAPEISSSSSGAADIGQAAVAATASEGADDDDQYDKVLVDAECTHDGSVRHLQKNDSLAKWTHYVESHLSAREVERILRLQHDLIRSGFRILRDGGVLVYSTCSLSVKQNEEIVAAFLKEQPRAELEPIERDGIPCEEGRLPGTIRFTPARNASGLFIAKIRKRAALLLV